MHGKEWVMITTEAAANYIPPKYAVMESTVGSAADGSNSYAWLKCISYGVDTEAHYKLYKASQDGSARGNSFADEAAFKAAKAAGFYFVMGEVVNVGDDIAVVLAQGLGNTQGTDWDYKWTGPLVGTLHVYQVKKVSEIKAYDAPGHGVMPDLIG